MVNVECCFNAIYRVLMFYIECESIETILYMELEIQRVLANLNPLLYSPSQKGSWKTMETQIRCCRTLHLIRAETAFIMSGVTSVLKMSN